jgi:hypothetical protein
VALGLAAAVLLPALALASDYRVPIKASSGGSTLTREVVSEGTWGATVTVRIYYGAVTASTINIQKFVFTLSTNNRKTEVCVGPAFYIALMWDTGTVKTWSDPSGITIPSDGYVWSNTYTVNKTLTWAQYHGLRFEHDWGITTAGDTGLCGSQAPGHYRHITALYYYG